MDGRDRLAAALQALTDDQLDRLSRSLEYRASQDLRNGRSARAFWRRTLRLLVTGEMARRDGQIRPLADAGRRLRSASCALSERELVTLIAEYRQETEDFEVHCGRSSARFPHAVLTELLQALIQIRRSSALSGNEAQHVVDVHQRAESPGHM